jgi:hypothetical protein
MQKYSVQRYVPVIVLLIHAILKLKFLEPGSKNYQIPKFRESLSDSGQPGFGRYSLIDWSLPSVRTKKAELA